MIRQFDMKSTIKKTIVLLIMMVLLCAFAISSNAVSDDVASHVVIKVANDDQFVFGNGVHFNDSFSETKIKEGLDDKNYPFNVEDLYSKEQYYPSVEWVSMYVCYGFSLGKLTEIDYVIGTITAGDYYGEAGGDRKKVAAKLENDYNVIRRALIDNYGEPVVSPNHALGKASEIKADYSVITDTEWHLNFGNDAVQVNALLLSCDSKSYRYRIIVSYQYIGKSSTVNNQNSFADVFGQNELPGTSGSWKCFVCEQENTTDYCEECGAIKPTWTCECGNVNHRKFCGKCGKGYEDLIAKFDEALAKASQQKYGDAISDLEKLMLFDSGTLETSAGDHISAKAYISKVYYDQGVSLLAEGGDHNKIIECFKKAGDYSDAQKQIQDENERYYKAFYDAGEQHLANGEYEKAVESFLKAGKYSDAAERAQKIHYDLGEKALAENDWDTASVEFSAAGNYQNAAERVQKAHYELAEKALAEERWADASAEFSAAGGYQDAESRINEPDYKEAELLLASGDYAAAIMAFEKLGDYSDSAERILKIHYDLAEKAMEEQRWDDASIEFSAAQKYGDAKSRIYEPYYLAAETLYNIGDYDGAIEFYEKAGTYKDSTSRMQEIKFERASKALAEGRFEDAVGAHLFFGSYEQDGDAKKRKRRNRMDYS